MKQQQIINAKIRLAVREGLLPYTFTDKHENTYRKGGYALGKELGKKVKVTKIGEQWNITEIT